MARPFILEIQESEEELKDRLKRTQQASQQEKLQMLWWVKSGQVSDQQEIATRLGRNTSTINPGLIAANSDFQPLHKIQITLV